MGHPSMTAGSLITWGEVGLWRPRVPGLFAFDAAAITSHGGADPMGFTAPPTCAQAASGPTPATLRPRVT